MIHGNIQSGSTLTAGFHLGDTTVSAGPGVPVVAAGPYPLQASITAVRPHSPEVQSCSPEREASPVKTPDAR